MSNNKFSISFGVKGFFPFPFSIVMQIYAHCFIFLCLIVD